jgi:hypothetical protein
MVEVVVSFAHGDQRSKHMVARRSPVIERLFSDPMCQTVHTEGCLLHEACADNACVHQAAPPVAPTQACDERGEQPCGEEEALAVVLVLPDDDPVGVEIGHVGAAFDLGIVVENHPPNVAEEKTTHDAVRIFHGVSPPVVGAVVRAPPSDAALDSAGTDEGEENAKRKTTRVAAVRPEAMVPACDAKCCEEVVYDAPDESWAGEGSVSGEVKTRQRYQDYKGGVEPVDLLVPISNGDILVLDVLCFLRRRSFRCACRCQ